MHYFKNKWLCATVLTWEGFAAQVRLLLRSYRLEHTIEETKVGSATEGHEAGVIIKDILHSSDLAIVQGILDAKTILAELKDRVTREAHRKESTVLADLGNLRIEAFATSLAFTQKFIEKLALAEFVGVHLDDHVKSKLLLSAIADGAPTSFERITFAGEMTFKEMLRQVGCIHPVCIVRRRPFKKSDNPTPRVQNEEPSLRKGTKHTITTALTPQATKGPRSELVLESGATEHVIANRSFLSSLCASDEPVELVTAENRRITAREKGTQVFWSGRHLVVLDNVWFAPRFQAHLLF